MRRRTSWILVASVATLVATAAVAAITASRGAAANLAKTLEVQRRLTAQRPNDPAVFNDLGNLLVLSGQPAEAETAYRRAMELDPTRRRPSSTSGWSSTSGAPSARQTLRPGGEERARQRLGPLPARHDPGVSEQAVAGDRRVRQGVLARSSARLPRGQSPHRREPAGDAGDAARLPGRLGQAAGAQGLRGAGRIAALLVRPRRRTRTRPPPLSRLRRSR